MAAAAKIRDFVPQALANTAWAYAKLIGGGGSSSPADGVGSGGGGGGGSGGVSRSVERLMELVLVESKHKLEEYNPQNVGE